MLCLAPHGQAAEPSTGRGEEVHGIGPGCQVLAVRRKGQGTHHRRLGQWWGRQGCSQLQRGVVPQSDAFAAEGPQSLPVDANRDSQLRRLIQLIERGDRAHGQRDGTPSVLSRLDWANPARRLTGSGEAGDQRGRRSEPTGSNDWRRR